MSAAAPANVRHLPPELGHNLRDLGGYATADGRRIKWRTLYRSGAIHRIGPLAVEQLRGLGITAICDLRTPHERKHQPMDWHDNLLVHYYGGVKLESGASLEQLLDTGMALRELMQIRMHHIYRRLPFEQAPSYRHLFALLAERRVPLLFNCAAGKDRTGLAAALILTALGVPRATILEDYLLSNATAEALRGQMLDRNPRYAELVKKDPEALRPILEADPAYLDMAYDEIEQRCGSMDAYLEQELGVTPAVRTALAALLLD
jgi:protein-tyrosine phosphatase